MYATVTPLTSRRTTSDPLTSIDANVDIARGQRDRSICRGMLSPESEIIRKMCEREYEREARGEEERHHATMITNVESSLQFVSVVQITGVCELVADMRTSSRHLARSCDSGKFCGRVDRAATPSNACK